tara:strand:- start:74 stop:502 length:429 start_codon:yes stop_codon:yes gene_type:complete
VTLFFFLLGMDVADLFGVGLRRNPKAPCLKGSRMIRYIVVTSLTIFALSAFAAPETSELLEVQKKATLELIQERSKSLIRTEFHLAQLERSKDKNKIQVKNSIARLRKDRQSALEELEYLKKRHKDINTRLSKASGEPQVLK